MPISLYRDVSGVELLMNYHQSLKAEIDSRDEKFSIAVALGRDILSRCHPKSQEVRERLISLGTQRGDMMQLWEDRWTHLQLILEVYQFARDAAVADSWLASHEPYLQSHDYGVNISYQYSILLSKILFFYILILHLYSYLYMSISNYYSYLAIC